MTETASKVSAALVAAQSEIGNVPFDSVNPHFGSKFVSLATTFAMPVQKRDFKREVFEHMGVSVSRTEREYDPFANI